MDHISGRCNFHTLRLLLLFLVAGLVLRLPARAQLSAYRFNCTTAENLASASTLKATFNVAATDQVTPKFWLVELIQ
jgi:hypothetical protein